MDLPVYLLIGLATGGYLLRKKRQPKTRELFQAKLPLVQAELHHESNGSNIINSTYFDKVQRMTEQAASEKFHQAYSDMNTNIIPFYYGWLNNSNLKRQANPDYDPNILKKELARVTGHSKHPSEGASPSQGVDPVEIVGELANEHHNYGSVPYREAETPAESAPRGHNNMVPFFGSSLKQNMRVDNVMGAKKLETFTGHFKLEQQHKQEVENMFAPAPQNLDQLVPLRENDRFVPSNLGKRHNELPFKQERVGPGLNQGFTATPSGGFHNPVRIMPKDNDELFVNPRTTHEGRVLRGKGPVPQRQSQSLHYKYKPETLVTNFDGERNFITTGAVKNPTARAKTFAKPTARQQFKEVKGPLGARRYNRPETMFAKAKISDRQNFRNTPFRNLVGVDGKKSNFDAHYNFENRRNERSVTGTRRVVNNLKALVNMVQMAFFDKAKKTRKESYIQNPNETGYVGTASKHKGTLYNPAEEAKMTHREITAPTDYRGVVGQCTKKSTVYNPTDEAKTTHRETMENRDHNGYLQGEKRGQVYDPSLLKTTVKELLETNSHAGHLTGLKKNKIFNAFDQAKTTHRETVESTGHAGQLSGNKLVGPSYNAADVAPTTIRETTETNSHVGYMTGGGQKRTGRTYNPSDEARTTVRETTETNSHVGQLTGNKKRGKGYNEADVARVTHRETTETNSHVGQLKGSRYYGQSYNPAEVAKTTGRETTETNSHTGQLSRSRFPGQSYNPADVAKTTGRETTETNSHTGQLIGNRLVGQSYNPADLAKTTVRETTETNSHVGQLVGGKRKGKSYNECDVGKTTTRETTETNSHYGQLTGRKLRGKAYSEGDVARTTVRETTSVNSHTGQLVGGRQRGRAYNSGDVARTTGRETTETNSHLGQLHGNQFKGKSYNEGDTARTTTRETTETNTHQGNLVGNKRKGRGYNQDEVARTTARETTETNSHVGNLTGNRRKGRGYNAADEARTTVRETTETNSHAGNLTGRKLVSRAYNQAEEARTTTRETTETNSHAGFVQSSKRKSSNLPPGEVAKTTGRETIETNSHSGHVQRGQRKGAAYNEADEARTTGRETIETNSHTGHVQRGRRKAAAYNEADQAKTTGRETIENNEHTGHVKSSKKKGRSYNQADEAKTTHRETTERTDYIGIMGDPNRSDGKGYQITNFEDKATQRQFSHFGYTGVAAPKGVAESQQLYDAAYNARTNTNKEKIAKGRSKQNPVLPLHAGKQFTNIEVRKLEEDRVNHYSSAPNPTHPNGRIPEFMCRLTSLKNQLPSEDTRLDTTILDPFKKNPLTQSLNSFA